MRVQKKKSASKTESEEKRPGRDVEFDRYFEVKFPYTGSFDFCKEQ